MSNQVPGSRKMSKQTFDHMKDVNDYNNASIDLRKDGVYVNNQRQVSQSLPWINENSSTKQEVTGTSYRLESNR